MSLDFATRITEILLAIAFLQQSIEHVCMPKDGLHLFLPRIFLSILLILGFWTKWVCLALIFLGLFILKRFQGPYNGGSDRMSYLILFCLTIFYFMPTSLWQEYIFGYLALQLVLSYFISGWVKVSNPQWRNGLVLQDIFRFSAYPVSKELRIFASWPKSLYFMSWAVMLFELLFPLTLITQKTLIIGLLIALSLHFVNACLFGLNRFFWVWLAAFPSLLWLQQRIFVTGYI